MNRLTIVARANSFTGYGEMLLQIFAGLEHRGVRCAIRSIHTDESIAPLPLEIKERIVESPQPDDIELLICTPNHFPTPGKRTVFYTMFEKTVLPPNYVEMLNAAVHVIVPCEWCRKNFVASGVKVPITVIPLGHSPDIFSYLPPVDGAKTVFGAAGRLVGNPIRKGVGRVIDVFQKAFMGQDDVELRVKVHRDCPLPKIDDPRVIVNRDHMEWHRVREWFGGIHAFVSLAASEGFGLWQLQSMACGRPVVAVRYSGMEEYHSEETGYVIPHVEGPCPAKPGDWATFNDADVIPLLNRIHGDHREAAVKGVQAYEVAKDYTWDRTCEQLYDVLKALPASTRAKPTVATTGSLTLMGHVNPYVGYGEMLFELFKGLEARDVDCSIRAGSMSEAFGATIPPAARAKIINGIGPAPWELMAIDPRFPTTPGRQVVRYTMWETSKLPAAWVKNLNQAQAIIVPCSWNGYCFQDSGVKVPITVIPLGFDPAVFSPMPLQTEKFVIGVAGRVGHGPVRKGVNRAMEIFGTVFDGIKDVELHVKVHPDCAIPAVDDPRIKVTAKHLDGPGLRQWFGGLSCFLSLATAEGFGLWQLQAMACGRPLIAARFSGMAEYHDDVTGYVIPHKLVPAGDLGGEWAGMDTHDIADTMMGAYSDWSRLAAKSALAAERARPFTWDACAATTHKFLSHLGAV